MGINSTTDGRDFDEFIMAERKKNINIIKYRYSLTTEDAEDVVSDAILDLYVSKAAGKLKDTVVSLASYFTKVCLNKCFHRNRAASESVPHESIDTNLSVQIELDRLNKYIDSVDHISEEAICVMRKIVSNLPQPCDKVLWSYYEDEMSMAEIASLTGLKDSSSAKSTKSNCISKLKTHYIKSLKDIKYGEI